MGTVERLFYAAVAAFWVYAAILSTQVLGSGGAQSQRDLHHFLSPVLAPSVMLAVAALTPRRNQWGYLCRWLALLAIVLAIGVGWPLAALYAIAGIYEIFTGHATEVHAVMFLGALAALCVAALVLLGAVLKPTAPDKRIEVRIAPEDPRPSA